MFKQSFIGDMFKAAVEIKKGFEQKDEIEKIAIVQMYIDDLYTYIVIRKFHEMYGSFAVSDFDNLLGMVKRCEFLENEFNVKCKYFYTRCHGDEVCTGIMVQ